MAAASRGAALGGSNPSGDGGPRLPSPPGKGNKPVALADITNTGRPNASRSISVADVVKENAKLIHLLNEKIKIIELSRVEMQKLHLALQASRQQNLQLAQTNSQMLVELNMGKDRIKTLQHELSCTTALLKVKNSEVERKNKTANQRQKEVNSQDVLKAIPSKVSAVEAHQIDGSVMSAVVESQSAVPSNSGCQDLPQDAAKKRNKRKSESSECAKDTYIMQDHNQPHLQPIMSLSHEDPRKPQRRRSSRLNKGCEINEVSHKTLHETSAVSSAPSTLSVQKQHGSTTRKDIAKSTQNECNAIVHDLASEFEDIQIDEQPQKEASLKEIQEACYRVAGVESHQIGDKPCNANQSHLAGSQSSVLSNITEPRKPPEDTTMKRGSNEQKLALCEKDSDIEDVNAKCDTTTTEALCCKNKRKSQRRKSARLNSVPSEDMNSTFQTEDIITPLAPSSLNASMEQRATLKQNDDCSSMKSTEGQLQGRRSLRRAAEKIVSYKEIPLNIKMRRP